MASTLTDVKIQRALPLYPLSREAEGVEDDVFSKRAAARDMVGMRLTGCVAEAVSRGGDSGLEVG